MKQNDLELLILDNRRGREYVLVNYDGSQLLFRIISDNDENDNILITVNLEFSKYGSSFTDD
ncbi:ATP-binding protein [Anaerovorax odorimutans]|uniref:ATP-binding protein n=1 Tax=Anaerovorax odorimutans TaxID=109327 RepID=A0ABT1RTL1_9FIRM|nr:ATP-binding protein [Anaerovorax odorimutans]MCQ4638517.1 ATP-binding protein [Anaerovorax odorimutans]